MVSTGKFIDELVTCTVHTQDIIIFWTPAGTNFLNGQKYKTIYYEKCDYITYVPARPLPVLEYHMWGSNL